MIGLTGAINLLIGESFWKDYSLQKTTVSAAFGLLSNGKFEKDKLLVELNDLVIGLDGAVFNLQELKNSHAISTNEALIYQLFQSYGPSFPQHLRGEFSGFLYEKSTGNITIFGNQSGSRRLFYYSRNGVFAFSASLQELLRLLRVAQLPTTINEVGCYMLLSYGFMLADATTTQEIRRIEPGCYIHYNGNQASSNPYYTLQNDIHDYQSKEAIMGELEERFAIAVRNEYDKDKEYNYRSVAFLSAGLDSRIALYMAHQLHYRDVLCLNFSQSGYYDERIPRAIAAELQYELQFYPLDNGLYLRNLADNYNYNDGQVTLYGSAHTYQALQLLNTSQAGIFHSGLVGDAVLGSFLSNKDHYDSVDIRTKAYSSKMLPKIYEQIKPLEKKYKNNEIFLMYNRGFNGALNGSLACEPFGYAGSPFLDPDFMDFTFSLPIKYRYDRILYREWIAKRHRNAAKHIWEKTRLPVHYIGLTYKPFEWIKKAEKVVDRVLLPHSLRASMNPFEYWYSHGEEHKRLMQSWIQDYANTLEYVSPELRNDVLAMLQKGTYTEKLQAVSLCITLSKQRHI